MIKNIKNFFLKHSKVIFSGIGTSIIFFLLPPITPFNAEPSKADYKQSTHYEVVNNGGTININNTEESISSIPTKNAKEEILEKSKTADIDEELDHVNLSTYTHDREFEIGHEINTSKTVIHEILNKNKKIDNKFVNFDQNNEFEKLTAAANYIESQKTSNTLSSLLKIIDFREKALKIKSTQKLYKLLADTYIKTGNLVNNSPSNIDKKLINSSNITPLYCYTKAIEYFQQAIETSGDIDSYYLVKELAKIYYNIGNLDIGKTTQKEAYINAIALYSIYLETNSKSFKELYYMSICYYNLSKLTNDKNAITCLLRGQQAIKEALMCANLTNTSTYYSHILLRDIYIDLKQKKITYNPKEYDDKIAKEDGYINYYKFTVNTENK